MSTGLAGIPVKSTSLSGGSAVIAVGYKASITLGLAASSLDAQVRDLDNDAYTLARGQSGMALHSFSVGATLHSERGALNGVCAFLRLAGYKLLVDVDKVLVVAPKVSCRTRRTFGAPCVYS